MVGFLDALCGPSASQLKVKDMDKYAFDPKRLLVQITTIVLRVWKQDKSGSTGGEESFTVSLATHPDYSQATMTKCCLLYTSPSPRDATLSRMPTSA